MKKVLLLLVVCVAFLATACGSSEGGSSNKSSRTVENLLDSYIKGITTPDVEIIKDIFPPFYIKFAESNLTKENLQASLDLAKEEYGDDLKVTYNITKTIKLTEEELKEVNETMKTYYNADTEATECYKYEGTITFKGSKSEDSDPISNMGYCKFDGSWYLIGG